MNSDYDCAKELGLCNIDNIVLEFQKATQDPTVQEICLWFDSPGGETTGIQEFGQLIANCPKKTKGWTETKSASAAYWLMSQCDNLGMTPSSMVGSIGCYACIEDFTGAMRMAGIKKELISSGKYKLLGSKFRSLTEEERNILQDDITNQHNKFKQTILSKRAVDPSYMEGLTYEGEEALASNLVDVVTDSFSTFLTTADNYMFKTKINKPQLEAPKTEAVAAEVIKKAEKEMPGVPGVEEPKTEETKPLPSHTPPPARPATAKDGEPVKEEGYAAPGEAGYYAECPSCKHIYQLETKHMLKRMEEEAEDGPESAADEAKETPEDEAKETPAEEAKEHPGETKDALKKDKDAQIKPEDDVKKEGSNQPGMEEEEPTKKMTLPSIEDWNTARGYTIKHSNAFLDAVNTALPGITKN